MCDHSSGSSSGSSGPSHLLPERSSLPQPDILVAATAATHAATAAYDAAPISSSSSSPPLPSLHRPNHHHQPPTNNTHNHPPEQCWQQQQTDEKQRQQQHNLLNHRRPCYNHHSINPHQPTSSCKRWNRYNTHPHLRHSFPNILATLLLLLLACPNRWWPLPSWPLLPSLPSLVTVATAQGQKTVLGLSTLQSSYPNHAWHVPVEASDVPRGPTRTGPVPAVPPFVTVRTDADQIQLYDENLELDLAPWRRRSAARAAGDAFTTVINVTNEAAAATTKGKGGLRVSELLAWASRLPAKASQRMVVIKGGRLGLLGQPGGSLLRCERPCDPVLEDLLRDLRTWLSEDGNDGGASSWPDVVFFLNVADTSLCHPPAEQHSYDKTISNDSQPYGSSSNSNRGGTTTSAKVYDNPTGEGDDEGEEEELDEGGGGRSEGEEQQQQWQQQRRQRHRQRQRQQHRRRIPLGLESSSSNSSSESSREGEAEGGRNNSSNASSDNTSSSNAGNSSSSSKDTKNSNSRRRSLRGVSSSSSSSKQAAVSSSFASQQSCPAPVLSLIKEWDRSKDEDILVPITGDMARWRPLHYFPWRLKIDRAVFRGRPYCHTRGLPYAGGACSRTYFAALSQINPEWSRFLDVGLVDNYTYTAALYGSSSSSSSLSSSNVSSAGDASRSDDEGGGGGRGGGVVEVAARGFVPTQELARFRYLLALDGITASSRLAKLLSLNSVVLKQTSPWIEWYYRSLVPGTHYVSFWNHHRTDVLQAIKSLRHKARYLADVATHAQAFSYRYLSPAARRLYWRRALAEYGGLFADMEEFLAGVEIPESE